MPWSHRAPGATYASAEHTGLGCSAACFCLAHYELRDCFGTQTHRNEAELLAEFTGTTLLSPGTYHMMWK